MDEMSRTKTGPTLTMKEHQAIITTEMNPERWAFYEFCWHLGGAQSDVASLTAEDIEWQGKDVSFHRHKTGTARIRKIPVGGRRARTCTTTSFSWPTPA